MEISNAYLLWFTSFFYFISGIYLIIKIRKDKTDILYPISIYLFGVATFFGLMGLHSILNNKVLLLLSALSIVLGSAYMSRFTLRLEWPSKEKLVYSILIILALLLTFYPYLLGKIDLMLRISHIFAFFISGVFVIGYILYTGIKAPKVRAQSFSTCTSLGMCCILAHGLAALQVVPPLLISLFGIVTVELPMIFAIISPFAFISVLILNMVIRPKNNVKWV